MNKFAEDNCKYSPLQMARARFSYTRYQLDLLNGIFDHIRYPNSIQKEIIARRVGITSVQVKVWFQNRRRKEVIIKEKPSNAKRASKNSGKATVPVFSSTPSSLIPSVILVSIVQELKRFTENQGEKIKLTQETESITNLPLDSCKSRRISFTDSNTLLKTEKSNSVSKKHSIYFSAFDIKSPPNQITPTVAFNLRSELYRGPSGAFSAEKLNHPEEAFQKDNGNMGIGLMPNFVNV